ncbi:stage V sporulation protein B [Alkalibacillus almallahensis]|uniref:stage V sporulation protein B n=1 Tax=Alkalibacillus almallahensis TaxID=1379154 RepID=UPI0014222ECD|nr:stage V sporulation protein B [Alkalibacillus almallahensis]NIK11266.1 stage V sporulation protein B [Alkalibacillus almallahensis]
MSKQTFIKGALILMVAGMISRLLGFINRIVLARMLGDEGVGIYMLTLPALFFVITLSQIGIPVAVSKLVAEAETNQQYDKIRKIVSLSLIITVSLSIVLTLLLVAFAPYISTYLILDERTHLSLLAISPIIIIIAISAVLRGYFQGLQNMKPQAIAQVIEQIIRIVFVFILVRLTLPYGLEAASAGAMVSVVIGEFGSLLYIYYCYKRNKQDIFGKTVNTAHYKMKQLYKRILDIALPTAGTRIIGSITYFLEPIFVSHTLIIAGYTISESTSLYGQLTGYIMPLLLLPTFITHSLSVALIPSISEAHALNHMQTVHYRIRQAIRLSFASGGIATVVFVLLASTLLHLMYDTEASADMLTFMAPFFLLLYIQAPLQATLQALEYAKQAMINSLIGAIVKLSTLWLLATQPSFGIDGVMLSIIIGVIVVTFLHIISLYKLIHFTIPLSLILKMLGLISVLILIGQPILSFLSHLQPLWYAITSLGFLCIIYLLGLILLRIVSKDEWDQLRAGRF